MSGLLKLISLSGDLMFEHESFDVYDFSNLPLGEECYLMDEVYLNEYEQSCLKIFNLHDYEPVGFVSWVVIRSKNTNTLELSWYPNHFTRFHEVSITLPKSQFVTCVGSWRYDCKPTIFVNGNWLDSLYLNEYSIFALVDAIGVRNALSNNYISRDKLITLRQAIDCLASEHNNVLFISFADSVILKSNWTIGDYKNGVEYTYNPEIFVNIADGLQSIYKEHLGLDTYAVISQGYNEYYKDSLHHISESKNHICLNSLGVPFEQLMSIETAVRRAISEKHHSCSELYMDDKYYKSINFKFGFNKNSISSSSYQSKMMNNPSLYFFCKRNIILDNIK